MRPLFAVAALFIVISATLLTGCAGGSGVVKPTVKPIQLYGNKVVVIKPFDSYTCPKNGKVTCINEMVLGPEPPAEPMTQARITYFQNIKDEQVKQITDAGADLSARLMSADFKICETSNPTGVVAALGGIATMAVAIVAGPGASDLMKGAIAGSGIGFASAGATSQAKTTCKSSGKDTLYLALYNTDRQKLNVKCDGDLAGDANGCIDKVLTMLTSDKQP
jgi:hypothetical protein